jgi:ribonucleotide monophosphatase NagD (HAD superfamily)
MILKPYMSLLLQGLGLQIVEDLEAADFILAHGTEAISLASGNGVKKMGLEKLEQILENAVDKGIPMIVANPDHVTVEARALRVMPGK